MRFRLTRTSRHPIRHRYAEIKKLYDTYWKVENGWHIYWEATELANQEEGDIFQEINTLEDLLELKKEFGAPLILTDYYKDDSPEIEIYDGYRE